MSKNNNGATADKPAAISRIPYQLNYKTAALQESTANLPNHT